MYLLLCVHVLAFLLNTWFETYCDRANKFKQSTVVSLTVDNILFQHRVLFITTLVRNIIAVTVYVY